MDEIGSTRVIWSTLSPAQCEGNIIYENVISKLSIGRLLKSVDKWRTGEVVLLPTTALNYC